MLAVQVISEPECPNIWNTVILVLLQELQLPLLIQTTLTSALGGCSTETAHWALREDGSEAAVTGGHRRFSRNMKNPSQEDFLSSIGKECLTLRNLPSIKLAGTLALKCNTQQPRCLT